jgi:hypothetical protein
MGKIKNNQKGFTAVEILLTLIFLAIIAAIGVYVAHNHNSAKPVATTNASTTTKSSKSTAAANPYSGWKQYCSPYEKSCFKYPSSWTFADNCAPATADCQGFDNVGITSPNGTGIGFTSSVSGLGGECESGTPDSTYTKVEPLTTVPGLYLVEVTRSDVSGTVIGLEATENGGVPKLGDTGTCEEYLTFTAKNTPSAQVEFTGTVNNPADLSTAVLIFNSYYYQ